MSDYSRQRDYNKIMYFLYLQQFSQKKNATYTWENENVIFWTHSMYILYHMKWVLRYKGVDMEHLL